MAKLDLLPPNALAESRQRAEVMSRISEVPTPVKDVWNPQRCPTPLLPYLAWAMSVDHWNPDWDEATKRRVIAASWDTHAHKGTVHAVEQAIAALGLSAELEEWFENNQRQRGTFGVRIPVGPDTPSLTPTLQADIEAAVSRAKRASQHHDIQLRAGFDAPLHIATTGATGTQIAAEGAATGRRTLPGIQGQGAAASVGNSTRCESRLTGRSRLNGLQQHGTALSIGALTDCEGRLAGRSRLNSLQPHGTALSIGALTSCEGRSNGRHRLRSTARFISQGISRPSMTATAHSSGRRSVVVNRSGYAAAQLAILHIRGTIS